MILRYYTDAGVREWHDHALRLLGTLHGEHDIAVEIDWIDEQYGPITDFPDDVCSSTPGEVYRCDFKRNRTLNQTIDQTLSKASERYGRLGIVGSVAVVDDRGTVRWASTLPDYADGYRPGVTSQTAMGLLEDITIAPSNHICVECLSLLDSDENFYPNYGYEFP